MIRLTIAFLCAAAACLLVAGAFSTSAQGPASSTPDPFIAQISSSSRVSATNPVGSFTVDTTANGRFVVVESNGDIATEKTATRNNQDGNREIFLYDYAQRRIFQITNTRSVMKPASSASPSPSPSPSPSVSPSPSPTVSPTPPVNEPANTQIQITNNRPMISYEPVLSGGNRTYTIVFSSNAPAPANFDGTDPGAPTNTDMNQEIWTYDFTVADTANLSTGADLGPIDLTTGSFTRVTNTPASRAPSPGSTNVSPFIADDNRDATISDDGKIIAFISTANLVGSGNTDRNPEVFLFNRNTSAFTQVTSTSTTSLNNPIFSSNPALNNDGTTLTFISNANLVGNNDDGGGVGNAEIYVANFNGTAVSGLRQATKTKADATNATVNVMTFGRRLSRDGRYIGFESLSADPKANGSNTSFYVAFVYDVTADTFTQVGPRATAAPGDPVLHVPVFTDYGGACALGPLTPCSVMFTSALNFRADGTFPATAAEDSTGLNPSRIPQIFLAPLPVLSTGPFTRLTNFPASSSFAGVGAFPSSSRKRFAFSRPGEIGGGNPDGSIEVYYELLPAITTESASALTLFTGASLIPVPISSPTASPTVSPTPSPSPSPSPSASPGVAPTGLAAGELAVVQGTFGAVTSATVSNANASESKRAPALPIELNGVSLSIGGIASGLYSVSSTQIRFVVPIGLVTGSYPLVINANGTVFRAVVTIVGAQPDIFTTTNGPGGRAAVCNATIAGICTPEPFFVTTNNGTAQVPTVLRVSLTGVRNTVASAINVRVGTTAIVASINTTTDLPGTDNVFFTLPANVDTGDLPIVITVGAASSRDTATAPHITINAGGSPLPNPIDGAAYFVRQHYLDFLGREPDTDGYNFWQNEINSCGVDPQCLEAKRINVSASFFLSIEFQQSGYLVYRTYRAAYGNIPNAPVPITRAQFLQDTPLISNGVIVNQSGWQQVLETNKQNYFANFVNRPEFVSAYPAGMTSQQFVDALYIHAGLAPAAAPNRAAAINEIDSAPPADASARARALRLVAEDPMLVQQEFNSAFVLMEYFGYLQRNPNDAPDSDFAGYTFWLGKLNQFNGDFVRAEMVKAFLSSIEYRQRFGQ